MRRTAPFVHVTVAFTGPLATVKGTAVEVNGAASSPLENFVPVMVVAGAVVGGGLVAVGGVVDIAPRDAATGLVVAVVVGTVVVVVAVVLVVALDVVTDAPACDAFACDEVGGSGRVGCVAECVCGECRLVETCCPEPREALARAFGWFVVTSTAIETTTPAAMIVAIT